MHLKNNKVKRIENEVRNWSFNQMRHKVCILKYSLRRRMFLTVTDDVHFQSCQLMFCDYLICFSGFMKKIVEIRLVQL